MEELEEVDAVCRFDCSPDNIIEVAVTLLSIILPAKATEYVLPALVCVSVCVCLSVCDHDN